MKEFENRVVLVTGAGRGIGRAVAYAFAELGAQMALQEISPINLDDTLAQARALGARAQDYVFDLAKKMTAQALIETVRDDFDHIDILVNCSHVTPRAPLLEMDEWDWRRTQDVNLNGAFFMLQSVGRLMRERGEGVIVNVAPAVANGKGYGAVRTGGHALAALTRAAAAEFAEFNIRVNAVFPGHAGEDAADPERGQAEVAELVVFLCSRASRALTGMVLRLHDGFESE